MSANRYLSLSPPRLLSRSGGYLWFPTMARLVDSRLLSIMCDYPDVITAAPTCQYSWSDDLGRSWSALESGPARQTHVALRSGEDLLLPYFLFPRGDSLGAPYSMVPRGKRLIEVEQAGVTFRGWPRGDAQPPSPLGVAGFVLNHQSLTLRDGHYFITLYGHFEQDKRYSLVGAVSPDGVNWTIRSVIAGHDCPLPGEEGPCEAAVCRIADGRLMIVFRLGSGAPYGQAWSSDEGMTWTAPTAMEGEFSVLPSLAVLEDGAMLLSGGRPGLFVWFNADGGGRKWDRMDLQAHHNQWRPSEPIDLPSHTSSYTELVALGPDRLICIYDRIPHGWGAIPASSQDTNSVWVVDITVGRT